MADSYSFDENGVKRIVKAVRKSESAPKGNFTNRKPHLNQPAQEWFLAIVVNVGPNGEPDYEDDRYYFQRAEVTNEDNDNTSAMTVEAITNEQDSRYLYDTCVNVAEQISRGHLIPCNQPVLMFTSISQDSPTIKRYWFQL